MTQSKVKQLEKELGGKWRYCGSSVWECNDKKRHIIAVAPFGCKGECGSAPCYYLYGDGFPRRIYFDGAPIAFCKCNYW